MVIGHESAGVSVLCHDACARMLTRILAALEQLATNFAFCIYLIQGMLGSVTCAHFKFIRGQFLHFRYQSQLSVP